MQSFFDTQQIYRNLAERGGFTESQAESLTNALKDVVAFNMDSLATKADIETMRSTMEAGFNLVRADFDSRYSELEIKHSEIANQIGQFEKNFENELQIVQQRLTLRLGGIMVAGIGVLAAIITLA